MKLASFGVATNTTAFPFHFPIIQRNHQVWRSNSGIFSEALLADTVVSAKERSRRKNRSFSSTPSPPPAPVSPSSDKELAGGMGWKKLSSKELGITTTMISKPTRLVLNGLKKNGYQVYLVGGCVRDLILKRAPKDFDVITSANLYQVMRTFSRCEIIGRRFPICHVHVDECIIEVSSFKTSERGSKNELPYPFKKPPKCDELDFLRWKNCVKRDFTINGLMFDPYSHLVYDYIGGLADIKKAKVRTVIPSRTSFQDDCARILRGIRIAARLDFKFTKETALAIRDFASTVLRLDKSRLHMEVNYMLSYGSAESSLRLLWKLGLLEILLPIQAAYFVRQDFRRRDERSNMLLSLFSNLDILLAPNRPCHSCLWAGLLVFHHALDSEPREPLVVAAFALAVHNGGNLPEAIAISKGITHCYDSSYPEILAPHEERVDHDLVNKVLDFASAVRSSLSMMQDENYISQAMSEYADAPYTNLALISWQVFLKVCDMFGCSTIPMKSGFVPKRGSKIYYDKLIEGDLAEVRHVFARVVFDTVYPPNT